MLKKISGKECVKILCNKFGFSTIRQKGSHVVLKKELDSGSKIGTVVPLHNELKLGTIRAILDQAKIPEEEFAKFT